MPSALTLVCSGNGEIMRPSCSRYKIPLRRVPFLSFLRIALGTLCDGHSCRTLKCMCAAAPSRTDPLSDSVSLVVAAALERRRPRRNHEQVG